MPRLIGQTKKPLVLNGARLFEFCRSPASWRCIVVVPLALASVATTFASPQTPPTVPSDAPAAGSPQSRHVEPPVPLPEASKPPFLLEHLQKNFPDPLADMPAEKVAVRFGVDKAQLSELRRAIALRRDARDECTKALIASPDGVKYDALVKEQKTHHGFDEGIWSLLVSTVVTQEHFNAAAAKSFGDCDEAFARQVATMRGVQEEDMQSEVERMCATLRRLGNLDMDGVKSMFLRPSIDLEGLVLDRSSLTASSPAKPSELVADAWGELNAQQKEAVDAALENWRNAFDALMDRRRKLTEEMIAEGAHLPARDEEAWFRKNYLDGQRPIMKISSALVMDLYDTTLASIDRVADALGPAHPRTIRFVRLCHHAFAPEFTNQDTADRMLEKAFALDGLPEGVRASLTKLEANHAQEAAALERNFLHALVATYHKKVPSADTLAPQGDVFKTNQQQIKLANATCEQILNFVEDPDQRQRLNSWWQEFRETRDNRWLIAP